MENKSHTGVSTPPDLTIRVHDTGRSSKNLSCWNTLSYGGGSSDNVGESRRDPQFGWPNSRPPQKPRFVLKTPWGLPRGVKHQTDGRLLTQYCSAWDFSKNFNWFHVVLPPMFENRDSTSNIGNQLRVQFSRDYTCILLRILKHSSPRIYMMA